MKKKKTAPRERTSKGDRKISPKDWVQVGLETLARDGIDAVRVEPLAVRLGVTKGSFYWHFKDRAAFHAAILRAWRDLNTDEIIHRVEAGGGSGSERLERLVELTMSNEKAGRVETAIRAWARTACDVASALAEIDQKRLGYVAELFMASGVERKLSMTRAKLIYLALIGSFFAGPSAALSLDPDARKEIVTAILS